MAEPKLEALRLYHEARSRREEGNVTGAFARYRRVLETAEQLGDRTWQAELAAEIAGMYQDAYDLIEARLWYGRALALARELDRRDGTGMLLYRTAQVAQLEGSMSEAEALFREALGALAGAADLAGEGRARAGLGQLLLAMKREAEGAAELAAALALLREADAAETAALIESIRGWRHRLGTIRYRRLIETTFDEPDTREALLR